MKNITRKTKSTCAWVLGGVASLVFCLSSLGQYSATQSTLITINDNTTASPYPSVIDLTKSNIVGAVEKVTVTLKNLKHGYANDVGVLLVAPNGANVVLMNNAGFGQPLNGVDLTFDADAANQLPQFAPITSGSWRPGDFALANFLGSAPAGPYGSLADFVSMPSNSMNGKWSLYVQDDSLLATGTIDSWTLNLYTTPVLASVSTNAVYLVENGAAGTVDLTVSDSSPSKTNLAVTASGGATSLVNFSATATPLTSKVTLTPKSNQYGTNTLTLTISDGFASVTTDLTVGVTFQNQSPTITITNATVATTQGIMKGPFNIVLVDVDNSASDLSIDVSSSATNIVSPAGVFINPDDRGSKLRKFTLVPNGNATGQAVLTFTVSDTNSAKATAIVTVNVTAETHPVFANNSVITLGDNVTNKAVITVANTPGVVSKATVAINGLVNVVPTNMSFALKAPGGLVTLLTPIADSPTNSYGQIVFAETGLAAFPAVGDYRTTQVASPGLGTLLNTVANGDWTLWVTNGGTGGQITGGWVLNLYIAPIITSTTPSGNTIRMPEGASTNIAFAVQLTNGQITNANMVTVLSTDTSLIKVANSTFSTSALTGSATLQAQYSDTGVQYGTNTVVVTARDTTPATNTFVYTVEVFFVNHNPTITFIQKQNTYAGVPVGPIPFTIGDVDLPAQNLTVTATSSDTKVLPAHNVVLGGTGKDRTVTLFPVGATAGQATVTIRVEDGNGGTAEMSFGLNVVGPGNPVFGSVGAINLGSGGLTTNTVTVNNLVGAINDVQVSLYDINPGASQTLLASNLNALLVSPHGKKSALILSHAGAAAQLSGSTLILADSAANALPTSGVVAPGTYRPQTNSPSVAWPTPSGVPAAPYYASFGEAFKSLSGTNANGTWTLYIFNDGVPKGTIDSGWLLSITTTPLVQQISNVTMRENDPTTKIPVSVGDDQPGANIVVDATSADPTIVTAVFESGSGGTRTLDITPVPYKTGSNIVVTVGAQIGTDAATRSTTNFLVTVYRIDLPPVISAIPDASSLRPDPVVTSFTAWDPQGDQNLQVTTKSLDTRLFPDANITVSGPVDTGSTTNGQKIFRYTISALPDGANFGGPSTINVSVVDAAKQTASGSFQATVGQDGPVFANPNVIAIPTGYPLTSNATPYPSTISVSGLNGFVTSVRVTLVGFRHEYPQDVNVLLVSPDGKSAILMSHAGGGNPVGSGLRLAFDQTASTGLPQGPLSSGTFLPTCFASGLKFAAPAPTSGYTTNLNTFAGISPNGDWKLFVMDDSVGATGSIDNGWLLAIGTSPAIAAVGDQSTIENTPLVLSVTLQSQSSDPSKLVLTAASSDDKPGIVSPVVQSPIQVLNTNKDATRIVIINPTLDIPSTKTNVNATSKITLTVTDTNTVPNVQNTSSFALTVLYSNQPPVVATDTNFFLTLEGAPIDVDFKMHDVDSKLFGKDIKLTSADQTLIPDGNLKFVDTTIPTNSFGQSTSDTLVKIRVTAATPFTFGTNTISFAISDGVTTTTKTVTIGITNVYEAPIITGLNASYTAPAAQLSSVISFGVSSPEGVSSSSLNVKATSSNQTLVTNANIFLGGSGDTRTIQFLPLGTVSGTTRINFTIDDGKATNTTFFTDLIVSKPATTLFGNGSVITVKTNGAVTEPYPITFDVTNLVGGIQSVTLELRGLSHNAPGNLDVLLVGPDDTTAVMLMSGAGGTTSVSDLTLMFDDSGAPIPLDSLTSGTNRPGFYTLGKRLLPLPAPQANYQGSLSAFQNMSVVNGTWKLYVSDLTTNDHGQIARGAFLTIVPKPNIQITSPTPPFVIQENGSLAVHFTITDSLTDPTNITKVMAITKASDNKGLLPTDNVAIAPDKAGVNGDYTVTLTPVAYTYGGADVTITAARTTVPGASADLKLSITVPATNYPPIVYRMLTETTTTTTPITVPILITDPDTALSDLSLVATPLNAASEAIIGTTNLVFAGSTNHDNKLYGLTSPDGSGVAQASLTLTPNPFAVGTATIALTVTDPKKSVFTNLVTSNLVVVVGPVTYDPTITSIGAQSITAGTTATYEFTVDSKNQTAPNLRVSATSSDQALVKNSKIFINPTNGGPGSVRQVIITAEAGVQTKATTTIAVTATDTDNPTTKPATTQFALTVVPTPERTYDNKGQAIVINDNNKGTPYPSTITVPALNGTIKTMTLLIKGFAHSYPADAGLLLVAPTGQKIVLMNKAGGGISVTNLNLTFDAAAATAVPQGAALTTGSFKPADWKQGVYDFPNPGTTTPNPIAHPYSTNLNSLIGSAPAGTWSLYAVDDTANDAGVITGGWSLSITTQPSIVGLADITIPESSSGSMPFSMADDSPSGPAFTFTVNSTNATLLPVSGFVVSTNNDGTGTNFTLAITPARNKFGTNYVTLNAKNIDNFTASSTFKVSVPFVQQPPEITLATNKVYTTAGATATVGVTYSDPQFSNDKLLVSYDSSNTALVPTGNIQLVGNTIQVRPFGAVSGEADITMTVAQPGAGGLRSTATFRVTVSPVVNLFGNGGVITINDFAPATPYPSAVQVPASGVFGKIISTKVTLMGIQHTYPRDISALLVGPQGQKIVLMSQTGRGGAVTGVDLIFDSTSNVALPDNGTLTTGTYRPTSYNLNPSFSGVTGPYTNTLTDLNGTSAVGTWNLYVQDEAQQDSGLIVSGWLLSFVTDAPQVTGIAPQTTPENTPKQVLFTISSAVTNASKLTVTPSASVENPPSLISKGLSVSGPTNDNGICVLTMVPGANLPSAAIDTDGTATIVLSVSDGTHAAGQFSFPLTVTYVNQGPILVGLANTNTPANVPLSVAFLANDPDTAGSNLVVTASSSDASLGKLALQSNGNNQTYTFTPNGATGSTVISVVVDDPRSTIKVTNNVTLTLTAPLPPVIAVSSPVLATANVAPVVHLTVTSPSVPVANLTFGATFTNASLVTGVSFAVTPSNVLATVALVRDAIGQDHITVTASDGAATGSNSFNLVVSAPPAPFLDVIGPQTVKATKSVPVPLVVVVKETGVPISALVFSAAFDTNYVGSVTFANDGTNVIATVHALSQTVASTNVTITVTDGFTPVSQTFALTIVPPAPPTLGAIAHQETFVNQSTSVSLAVTSPDTAISNLVFSATFDSNVLTSVTFPRNGTAVNATLNVVSNKVATASPVTITVNDGYTSVSQSFTLTIKPTASVVLGAIAAQTTLVDVPVSVNLVVTSQAVAITNLTYTWSSTNAALVKNVAFSYNGSNEVATVELVSKHAGTDHITITVSDGFTSDFKTFTLTVTGPTLVTKVEDGKLKISFTAAPKASYLLQSTSNLQTWTDAGTITVGDDGNASTTLTPSAQSPLFYRVVVQ